MAFEVDLTPADVVPPVSDSSVAFGNVEPGERESGDRAVSVFVVGVRRGDDFQFPSINPDSVLAVHIHEGPPGANGPILWIVPLERSVDYEITAGRFAYSGPIPFEQFWNTLQNDATYLDIHTTTYPEGHLRGTLRLVFEQDWHCPSAN